MGRHRLKICMLVTGVLIMLAGCSDPEEERMDLEKRAEARAAEVHGYIDDLAAEIGSDPDVRQDVITPCEPGDDDSGLEPVYFVHVAVGPGTIDRVRGEIADRFEADGWTVRRDPSDSDEVSTRFLKGTFSMGINVNEKVGKAAIGGSGGCVR